MCVLCAAQAEKPSARSPAQNPSAIVQQLTSYTKASWIKRGHMVIEESGEVGTRRPMYAIFVHLKGHIATCLDVCGATLGQKIPF